MLVTQLEHNVSPNVSFSRKEVAPQIENNIEKNNELEKLLKTPTDVLLDEYEKTDEFLNTCTDGIDDGKLGFKEKAIAFGKGCADYFVNQINDIRNLIKEHPVACIVGASIALAVGIAAFSFAGPAILTLLSVGGIGIGIINIFKAGKEFLEANEKAKNATTDAEAKQAYADMGGNTVEIAENAAAVWGGVKGLQHISDDVAKLLAQNSDDIGIRYKELLKHFDDGIISEDEFEVMKEIFSRSWTSCTQQVLNPSTGVITWLNNKETIGNGILKAGSLLTKYVK